LLDGVLCVLELPPDLLVLFTLLRTRLFFFACTTTALFFVFVSPPANANPKTPSNNIVSLHKVDGMKMKRVVVKSIQIEIYILHCGAERILSNTASAGIRVAEAIKQIGNPIKRVQAIDSIPG
jgi:hypothetical protein